MNWTSEKIEYLRKVYPFNSNRKIAEYFCTTVQAVTTKAGRLKIKKDPGYKIIRFWNKNRLEKLKDLYPNTPNKKIAEYFGVTISAVKNQADKLRINKGDDYKNPGLFGRQPWNKGMNYVAPGSEKTQFKKGQIPHTAKIGEITFRKDHGENWYMYYYWKGKRIPVQHIVYKSRFGEVPEGHIITFKDGNTLNVKPDNLILISRSQNAKRNINRKKASETMRKIWQAERVRKLYGLSPKTGLGKRLSCDH